MVRITCEDGVVRHPDFNTIEEAQEWSEWGHCCTVFHTIEEFEEVNDGTSHAER